MNTPSIKVALADNNCPHVETTADYKESLFLQQYTLCFNQVNSILKSNQSIDMNGGMEEQSNG